MPIRPFRNDDHEVRSVLLDLQVESGEIRTDMIDDKVELVGDVALERKETVHLRRVEVSGAELTTPLLKRPPHIARRKCRPGDSSNVLPTRELDAPSEGDPGGIRHSFPTPTRIRTHAESPIALGRQQGAGHHHQETHHGEAPI